MPSREIALDTAAFLDSPQASGLDSASRSDAQRIVESFLACAYDDVGKAPRLLDGDDMHAIVGHLLPARFARKDPVAAHVAAVLRRYLEFVEQRAIVPQAYEMRGALEGTIGDFERAVATGHAHSHGPAHAQGGPPAKPFVNRAAKVGRNDPCPCGSGKKFKQCCAKL